MFAAPTPVLPRSTKRGFVFIYENGLVVLFQHIVGMRWARHTYTDPQERTKKLLDQE